MIRRSPLRTKTRMSAQSDKKRARYQVEQYVCDTVRIRSGGRCEVVLDETRCRRAYQDLHHIVKRSAGGLTSESNLIAVCRWHHDLTDMSTRTRSESLDGEIRVGRLRIEPGTFACRMETA